MAPSVALARAAQRRGHRVRLAAPADAEVFVRGQGLRYVSLSPDYQALAASPDGRAALAGHPRAVLRLLAAARAGFRATLDATCDAARDADVLVAQPKVLAGLISRRRSACRRFSRRRCRCWCPTRAFPAPVGPSG